MKTIKSMSPILGLFALLLIPSIIGMWYESTLDPYEEGMHMSYSIKCENGFVYKTMNKGAIQVFNSDGTPLRCGKKIY